VEIGHEDDAGQEEERPDQGQVDEVGREGEPLGDEVDELHQTP
jgi:hypothetical protein